MLQIVLKATPSKNYTSRIALDSFILTDGLCDDESELESNQQGLNIWTNLIVASDIYAMYQM